MLIDGQVFVDVVGFDHLNGAALPTPQPQPQHTSGPDPPPSVSTAEFFEALQWLDKLYREQMGRANGVDLEGIAAHIYSAATSASGRKVRRWQMREAVS